MTFLTIPNKGNYIFVFKKKRKKLKSPHSPTEDQYLTYTEQMLCVTFYIYIILL